MRGEDDETDIHFECAERIRTRTFGNQADDRCRSDHQPHFKAFVFEIDAPAADKMTRQVYLKEIEKSDVYLLLVGDTYGCCKEGGVSLTEQEYDKAVELGKTKLVMVRGADNSKREEREAKFLNKVSDGRVRVRYR